MTEEFQLDSRNLWDNDTSISRNRFNSGSSSTPTTSTLANTTMSSNYSSNWPTETHVDIKLRTFLDFGSVSESSGGGGDVLSSHDPNFQIMGLGLTSQGHERHHQSLLRSEKVESDFSSILQQEDISSNTNNYQLEANSHQDQHWSTRQKILYSGNSEDFSSQMNIRGFSLDQNNPIFSHSSTSTMSQQGGLYNNINPSNYGLSQETTDWSKFPQFLRTSPPEQLPLPQSLPSLPPPHSQLHFSNNTPFWNARASAMNDVPSSLFPSNLHNPQLPNPTVDEKAKNMGDVRDINRIPKKNISETLNKRPRNETPSPSPAFKVRKEKMGDRINALQQLVSPFGKTDIASVLSEAIEYIKFLHDQIGALSAPYMKSTGASMQHQQSGNKLSEDASEGRNKDLRGRRLCLVPISSAFPVTHETTVDFWTPTFGATFR